MHAWKKNIFFIHGIEIMGFSFLPLFLRLFTMTVADSHYTRTYVISFKYIYLLITLYKFFMKSIFRVNMINISKIILYFAYLSCNYASKEGTLFLKWVSKTIHSHDIFLSLSMEVHWSHIFIEKYMYNFDLRQTFFSTPTLLLKKNLLWFMLIE